MSDNASEDQPAGSPFGEHGAEAEVDALLENTAALAAELGGEVGASQTEDQPDPVAESPPPADGEQGTALDAQLEEIEALLGTGDDGPGEGEGEPTAVDEPAPADAAAGQATSPLPVGDTQEPSPPGTEGPQDKLPVAAEPAEAPPEAGQPSQRAAETSRPEEQHDQSTVGVISGPMRRVQSLLAFAAHRGLDLLDWIDRPLSPIGERARRIVGWVALATLFAAGYILFFSRFG
jgi:hypothetical protein